MFQIFKKKSERLKISGFNIFINNQNRNIGEAIEISHVFEFTQAIPEINILENDKIVKIFKIEPLKENPDISGQYLHSSIRILANSAVMIDGIISYNRNDFPKWTDSDYEAIRLQPFYLSNADEHNKKLIGKGLFERGLHFIGTITPSTVRNICICDSCNHSFTIRHFHAGFSKSQYFYSSDGKETLIVPYGTIENMPVQLQENIDSLKLQVVEEQLPIPSNGIGAFNYYNSFKCPYCLAPYIDFKNKAIRPKEYYGNFHINQLPKRW